MDGNKIEEKPEQPQVFALIVWDGEEKGVRMTVSPGFPTPHLIAALETLKFNVQMQQREAALRAQIGQVAAGKRVLMPDGSLPPRA